MILKEINKRLYNYETGNDYSTLQITFNIKPPIYLTSPWIHFDGLLSYLCTRDALDDLFYCMPTETTIDTSMIDLPLNKTKDVNHSSVGIFDKAFLYKDTIYKRFTDKEMRIFNPDKIKGRLHTNRGYFKDFMINLPLILSNQVIFYCEGDKTELKRLLNNLTQIGKKISIGGGMIQSFKIEETDQDYSFFKDGKVMRPIPSSMKVPVVPGAIFSRLPYKPPYWDKENVTMCLSPESQIKIGE